MLPPDGAESEVPWSFSTTGAVPVPPRSPLPVTCAKLPSPPAVTVCCTVNPAACATGVLDSAPRVTVHVVPRRS